MSDTIVNTVKVAFVAVLYGYLFFVVRGVRSHLDDAATTTQRRREQQVAALRMQREGSEPVTVAVNASLVVGRGSGADLPLDDEFASDRHARFDVRDGKLFVEDLGSTNGTFVNGERITGRTAVVAGDTVRIGETDMEPA